MRRPLQPEKLDMVHLLLSSGASTRATDEDGRTALNLAVERGDVQMALLLPQRHHIDAYKNITEALTE